MFQIKLQTVCKLAEFSGEVENERKKKPDDFISSKWRLYGQCGVNSPI